ncbi:hypothetical protein SARC_13952 [Sphaeroforma arctica JP610]|uniref:Uncharacterized protein n=1 Tax=Sphaeroforma arctica JP610 TaxID=667725 RepID=A0A0L0F9V1_9EUKA|nr:hypothetical protein SARC_13952 [Sphaeroforma arctica JP610]KNC73490.1 hypothetical protein SARC_13952 [Sphaeroforma arctica JP610]|eukprot:XP_014147392.1 hypothetical protein SARC_13952 [Sphaeroforma arctica JP610]
MASFKQAASLYERILRVKDKAWVPCVLVGNKCDLEHDREVDTEEGNMLAQKWNVPYVETSAKTRHNVDQTFSECVRVVRKNFALESANSAKKPIKKKKGLCTIL